jgi:FkbM family methyltransferase
VWEPTSTKIVRDIVKSGDVVLDIGANIGYYTVIISKIVGNSGKVLAFEPTKHFAKVLKENIKVNKLENVSVYEYGLSNKESESDIFIGDNSATIHWLENQGTPINKETISLKALDSIIDSLNIEKIDFIKIDVDGHEPSFLEGAWKTLSRYKPKILLEVAHASYFRAGFTAWDFYNEIRSRGSRIFSEKNMLEYQNLESFLNECGNFDHGVNVLIIP